MMCVPKYLPKVIQGGEKGEMLLSLFGMGRACLGWHVVGG